MAGPHHRRARRSPGRAPARPRSTGPPTAATSTSSRSRPRLTPFGSAHTPAVGRHSMTFTVRGGDRAPITLTPEQTALAGAGLGTGRHLFFRINAVRKGQADSQSRRYCPTSAHHDRGRGVDHERLRGCGSPPTTCTCRPRTLPATRGRTRQYLIAKNIARPTRPWSRLEELMPSMWNQRRRRDRSPGRAPADRRRQLQAHPRHGLLPRSSRGHPRILYDANQVQMTSACDATVPSCYIDLPDPRHGHVAAYARFKDLDVGAGVLLRQRAPDRGNDADHRRAARAAGRRRSPPGCSR